MHEVFLLTGSNLGDRKYFLDFALAETETAGKLTDVSGVYESLPWGYESENSFLNQCVKLETNYSPLQLLKILKEVEQKAGRVYKDRFYADRCLDMDILFYGSEIIQKKNLIIPHPRLHLRAFTLVPLAEIAPDFVHPVLQKKIVTLLEDCEDKIWPLK